MEPSGGSSSSSERGRARLRIAHASAAAASAVAGSIAGLALVGHVVGATTFYEPLPAAPGMSAITACAVLSAALALWFLGDTTPQRHRAGRFCAAASFLIGMIGIGSWTLVTVPPDQLLIPGGGDSAGDGGSAIVAPGSAIAAMLIGAALLTIGIGSLRTVAIGQVLAAIAVLVTAVPVASYLYDRRSESHLFEAMAPNSALAFVLLAVGVLTARPDRGFIAPILEDGAAGIGLRRLLPTAVVLPLTLGGVRLFLERRGILEQGLSSALLTVATAGVLTALIVWNASVANRSERARRAAEAERIATDQRFRAVAETAAEGIVSSDASGHILYMNRAASAIFGCSPGALLGEPLTVLMPEAFRERHRTALARFAETGESRAIGGTMEVAGLRTDGSEFPLELSLAAWNAGGAPAFTAILRDVSSRKRIEDALAMRTAQLEEANRGLEAFSYSVAHDLRAPLRAIDGFGRLLEQSLDAHASAEQHRLLSIMLESAHNMGELIDDLLRFSRLGRRELTLSVVDMTDVARRAGDDAREADPDRDVDVAVGSLPRAWGDRSLLRLVFANLMQNAVKFTRGRADARIEVSGRTVGSETIYRVADNGVGFDMRYAGLLFRVFQRLHPSDEFEGAGIGLATVQQIVQRHGGRVWADGKPGEGAVFYFALPRRRVP